ncbi:hypothetical protein DRO57_05045 [Candidatus Bathyarchaeota archaeon]|nr:MAG: hypothetical protein DRO57_05045 [Candidatus Bathyarchaeota archaeon]
MSPNLKTRPPGVEARRMIGETQKLTAPVRLRIPLVVKGVRGSEVEDVDGNTYIDMDCGRGLQLLRFGVEDLTAGLSVVSYPAGDVLSEYTYRLLETVKGFFGEGYKFHLSPSGFEAFTTVYSSILEVSRGGSAVVFHTRNGLSAFGSPFSSTIRRVPYPYCYRCPLKHEHPGCGYACVDYFRDVLDEVEGSVSLVVFKPVDPVRCIVPPEPVWRRIVKISHEAGCPVLCDETDLAPGRSGKRLWHENLSIRPEAVCLGDGLASGLPIGLAAVREELAVWKPKPLTANPISCVAGLRLLERLRDGRLLSKAHKLGRSLRKRLEELSRRYEVPGEVRGLGLMVGFEVVEDESSKKPAQRWARFLVKYCFTRGLILGLGPPSTIRLTPTVDVDEKTVEQALTIIEDGFKELKHAFKP